MKSFARLFSSVVLAAVLATGTDALAREAQPQPVAYEGTLDLFSDFAYDTGWIPEGSPVQVRFALLAGSGWQARLAGQAVLSWPEALELRMVGDPLGGSLAMDLGVEIIARLRLQLDTPAGPIAWEGDIPYVPTFDLRFVDQTTFDPFLLAKSDPATARVEDTVPQQTLLSVDLTDVIIPVPGISGSISLMVGGTVAGALRGTSVDVDRDGEPAGQITEEQAALLLAPTQAPRLELAESYHAELTGQGALLLSPAVTIDVVGLQWDVPLFTIPVDLAMSTLPWDFDAAPSSFALPDIEVRQRAVDCGSATPGTHVASELRVWNVGELDLVIATSVTGDAFSVAPAAATIAPGGLATLTVAAVASDEVVTGEIVIVSNDPDEALLRVPVVVGNRVPAHARDGGATDSGAAGADGTGGCGCVAGSGRAGVASALGAALLLLACRRRRRS
jgi:hypothetical protein